MSSAALLFPLTLLWATAPKRRQLPPQAQSARVILVLGALHKLLASVSLLKCSLGVRLATIRNHHVSCRLCGGCLLPTTLDMAARQQIRSVRLSFSTPWRIAWWDSSTGSCVGRLRTMLHALEAWLGFRRRQLPVQSPCPRSVSYPHPLRQMDLNNLALAISAL